MEYVIFFALVLVALVAGFFQASTGVKPWLQAVADELGLRMTRILSLNRPGWRLQGTVDGLEVVILHREANDGVSRAEVSVRGSIPPSLRLEAEGAWQQVEKAAVGADIETGDAEFDARVNVRGAPTEALAVLTEPVRQAAARMVAKTGATVSDGAVRCRTDTLPQKSESLLVLVRFMLAVARCLALEASDVAPRLCSNAALDPNAAVRLRNLQGLTRAFRGSEIALKAAETALADPDALMKLFGALAVAAEPAGSDGSDRLDRAMTTLVELRDGQTSPSLIELLAHGRVEVAWAAATALGLVGRAQEVEPLRERARGMLADSQVKQAVQTAVARMQSRLGNVEPGGLSLAAEDAPEGALSTADEAVETGTLGLTGKNGSETR